MRPQRCICVLLCAAALANCLTGCGAKTKAEAASEMQAKYDKIQVGMTAQEVDTILHDVESGPRGSGSYLKIVEDEHGHRISVLISNGKVELKVQHGLDD